MKLFNLHQNQLLSYQDEKLTYYKLQPLTSYIPQGYKSLLFFEQTPFVNRKTTTNKFIFIRDYPNLKSLDKTNFGYILPYTGVIINEALISDNLDIKAISYPFGFLSIFGKGYDKNTENLPSFLWINLNNKTFKKCDGYSDILDTLNLELEISIYKTVQYSHLFFLHFSDIIFVKKFLPYYETIQYPYLFTIYNNILFNEFEIKENEEYNLSLYVDISEYGNCFEDTNYRTINIKKFKLVFSKDLENWYRFNTQTREFELIENYDYNTHLEQGNSYKEYLSITKEEWLTKFLDNDKLTPVYFSINGTLPPISLDVEYFIDFYGTSDILVFNKPTQLSNSIFRIIL
jgi:hypothetical protein